MPTINALVSLVSWMFLSIFRYADTVTSKVFEFVVVFLCHILGVRTLAFRRGIIVIIVTCVSPVFELRDDRTLDPSVVQGVPIDCLEKSVRLDQSSTIDTATGNIAKPLRWIDGTETSNEIAGIG